jgi:hypothetical protein
MNLPVTPILQKKFTSCGEAAIVMAFNYASPHVRVTENEVINLALQQGLYSEIYFPFTSPENMVHIGEYYGEVFTGSVKNAEIGLSLLIEKLTGGTPVIIDILVQLGKPNSGPHFVVVTGLKYDPRYPRNTRIYFNDPLAGTNRWAYWSGKGGVWNAWATNGDPGGSGWWMTISPP